MRTPDRHDDAPLTAVAPTRRARRLGRWSTVGIAAVLAATVIGAGPLAGEASARLKPSDTIEIIGMSDEAP